MWAHPQRVPAGKRAKALALPFFKISAASGEGLAKLLEALWAPVAEGREAERAEAAARDDDTAEA